MYVLALIPLFMLGTMAFIAISFANAPDGNS